MTFQNFTIDNDADGIALVTWDMPDRSMNVLTEEVMDELEKIIGAVTTLGTSLNASLSTAGSAIR